MPDDLKVLHRGGRSDQCRRVQAAANRRARARDLDSYTVAEDGVCGTQTLTLVRKTAWALGALSSTYEAITREGEVPVGVQRMILNPGRRSDAQNARAKARVSALRADRAHRAHATHAADGKRAEVVRLALQAAQNYARNPGAYHYLAGGVANVVFLEPTPRSYRSDCSQFCAAIDAKAGVASPAGPKIPHRWASTYSMAAYLPETKHPEPGDYGMYGSRTAPHHVERYCALPGREFIGHGSPPIDSLTPGRPDFYLSMAPLL